MSRVSYEVILSDGEVSQFVRTLVHAKAFGEKYIKKHGGSYIIKKAAVNCRRR
jgi:hypothetical protein